MRRIAACALTATIALLAGCLYIPGEGAKPFEKTVTAPIMSGKSTRTDVLAALGDPRFRYLDDRLFAYADWQYKGLLIVGVAPGAGAVGPIGKNYYLIVEFDDDGMVLAVDRVTPRLASALERFAHDPSGDTSDDKRCTTSGYCLPDADTLKNYVPLLAAPRQDAEAKRFIPDSDKCILYVLLASGKHPPDGDAILDNKLIARGLPFFANRDVYYRHRVNAGRHAFRVSSADTSEWPKPPLVFDCAAGDMKFFELATDREHVIPTLNVRVVARELNIRELNDADGRRAISEKKLAIDPFRTLY